MKIEKINDNQIRFILSGEDLAARQIRLSELAYGTEKARNLFQEMMEQAASECGFQADNIPLMIEAIPMRSGSIVLIVTKVENPEELNARFSSFSPAVQNGPAQGQETTPELEQLLQSICSGQEEQTQADAQSPAGCPAAAAFQEMLQQYRDYALRNRLYLFNSMEMVLQGAARVAGLFTGGSMLFEENGTYGLLLTMEDVRQVTDMQNVLAILSEYGSPAPFTAARQQYLTEHGRVLIGENALQALSLFS